MNISFLGQGFEHESPNSVGNNLIKLFQDKKFNSFIVISAFASESGILGLTECIESSAGNFDSITIIVGVDQEGTSIKALEKIRNLGVTSRIFYQKESPIFHPKIYLFEGQDDYTLIVGSSNLTGRGLFANVESSIMLEGKIATDAEPLNQMKEYYSGLFDLSDPNLFEITTENIKRFVDQGIVPTKTVWKLKHRKQTSDTSPKAGNDLEIPKRKQVKIPDAFKGRYRTNSTVNEIIEELEVTNDFEFDNTVLNEILWESGELTERDLNIPKGGNTNPTGSMLLKKGTSKTINPRHYFRDVVFNTLTWTTQSKTVHIERSIANFRIIIQNIDYGIYSLKLSHNTRSEHLERVSQPATQIHWGEAKKLIAHDELIGKTAYLYRTTNQSDEFTLVIQ
jgi:Predicted HKD family nuclease